MSDLSDVAGASDTSSALSPLAQYFRNLAYGAIHDPWAPADPFPWKSVLPSSATEYQQKATEAAKDAPYTRAPRVQDGRAYAAKFLNAYDGGTPVTSDDILRGLISSADPRMQAVRGVGDVINMIRGTNYRAPPPPPPGLPPSEDSDLHA